MKNKLKSLYETLADSIHETKESVTKLNPVSNVKKTKSSIEKDKMFSFTYSTIVEANKETIESRNEARTITEVLQDFGNLPALNAKYGSFETFMKQLNLPATEIVSLYSFYRVFVEKEEFLVLVLPDCIRIPELNGDFFVKTKGEDKKSFSLKFHEAGNVLMYEDVQIGLRPETKNPYFSKIKYPVSIGCFKIVDVPYKNEHTDLNLTIKNVYKEKYPEANTVSEIFTQSILCPHPTIMELYPQKSSVFKSATKRIYDYRIKRSNSH